MPPVLRLLRLALAASLLAAGSATAAGLHAAVPDDCIAGCSSVLVRAGGGEVNVRVASCLVPRCLASLSVPVPAPLPEPELLRQCLRPFGLVGACAWA